MEGRLAAVEKQLEQLLAQQRSKSSTESAEGSHRPLEKGKPVGHPNPTSASGAGSSSEHAAEKTPQATTSTNKSNTET